MPNAYTVNEDMVLKRLENDAQRPFMRQLATDNLNTCTQVWANTHDRLTAFKGKKAAVLADRAKSEEGKATAIAQLATSALPEFKYVNVVATREADTAAGLRQDLLTIKTPASLAPDLVLQFLVAKDIRDRYANRTPQERDLAVLQVAEAEGGDAQAQANRDAILWAFQQTPGGPTITPDILQRALEARARRLYPAVYAQLEQADMMAEHIGGLRDHVVLWLRGAGVDPKTVYHTLGGEEPAPSPIEGSRRQVTHV